MKLIYALGAIIAAWLLVSTADTAFTLKQRLKTHIEFSAFTPSESSAKSEVDVFREGAPWKYPHSEKSAPIDHPPAAIRVGDEWYGVHYTDRIFLAAHNSLAFTEYSKREIWLPEDANKREMQEDMVHELLHASLRAVNGPWGSNEDGYVKPEAEVFAQILRDNRSLSQWLEAR